MTLLRGPVLVVDDDAEILGFLEALLEMEGIEATLCKSAREAEIALARAPAWTPRLVLLDIAMPDRDGIDFCRSLKRDPHTRDIPVFVVSAKRGRDVIDRALAAGADQFIGKPFENSDLLARIDARLSS